jgi:hypothetical protein
MLEHPTICSKCDHCHARQHVKAGSDPYVYTCLNSKTTHINFVTGKTTDHIKSCGDVNTNGSCESWTPRSDDKEPIPI